MPGSKVMQLANSVLFRAPRANLPIISAGLPGNFFKVFMIVCFDLNWVESVGAAAF
jgi:hypothetical protein